MKKITRRVVLAVSVIAGFFLLFHLEKSIKFSDYVIDEKQLAAIMDERTEKDDFLVSLIVNEETLFYDSTNKTFITHCQMGIQRHIILI